MAGQASAVITDVTLRDGLQNESVMLTTSTKLALLDEIVAAGLKSLEVGSFVRPDLVPQMADTEGIFSGFLPSPDVKMIALVPNVHGAHRALAVGVRHVRVVLSCTEGHSRANTNRTVNEGIAETRAVVELLRTRADLHITGALATAFVCPYDGVVTAAQVSRVVSSLFEMGLHEIGLSDTLGKADPVQVEGTIARLRELHPAVTFGLHLHNTYGMGLANVVAGLRQGIVRFDGTVGGIGGCPFAPGAAGNVATEDIVFMLHAMGVNTGVDLRLLQGPAAHLSEAFQGRLNSSVSRALRWT